MTRARSLLPPALAGIVIIGLWQIWVSVAEVKGTILPAPSAIWDALQTEFDIIRLAATNTASNAVKGLLLGGLGGVLMALLTTRFRPLERGLTPLAVILAATPIIVLAPISNIWFGLTNPMSKVIVVSIVAFFPVYLNTLRGLDAASANDLELMRSYGSSRLTTLVRVQIPTSVPMMFTGLKLAASLAMITAIIAEYFGGTRQSLGVFITQQASLSRYDVAWAGIVAACTLALVLYGAVLVLERVVAPWRSHQGIV